MKTEGARSKIINLEKQDLLLETIKQHGNILLHSVFIFYIFKAQRKTLLHSYDLIKGNISLRVFYI